MPELASTVRELAARTPDSRERSVDMWRAAAIVLVVLGHWFVIAVVYRDGQLSGYNALDVLTWVDPVTWLFQVMPIFFFIGGYAAAAALESHLARGGDGMNWVLRRTDRLLRPTTALFLVLPLAAVVARAAGVGRTVLGTAAWLASVPLWFLLVYFVLVVLTPGLYALHRRFGLVVPAVLLALVAVADVLRTAADVPIVGETTYVFAWATVYQLGFCWRDGLLRLSPRQALAVAAVALAVLIAVTGPGPYALAMVGYNTNPPTLALMALAVAQVGLVLALRPAVNRWLRRIGPWSAVVAGNAVVLTVFLWHMTAAGIAGAVLFPTGIMAQPPVDSGSWLLWRLPWIALCSVALAVLVALFAPIELRSPALRTVERSVWRYGAAVLGVAAVAAGLLGIAVSDADYHGPLGLPWPAVMSYLAGAAVLRALRSPRGRSRHTR